MSTRPYLTEDDHLRLYNTQRALRFAQYLAEGQQQPIETELLASYLWLLEAQLAQVLASAEEGSSFQKRQGATR